MAAITRLGSSGYGVKRAGSFAGKAAALPGNVKKWTVYGTKRSRTVYGRKRGFTI